MTNIEDQVNEAKAEIESARLKLVDAYLERLRNVYQVLILSDRDGFLNGLEKIVKHLEINPLPREGRNQTGLYNPELAREAREHAGVTQVGLAKHLGLKYSSMINRYERGVFDPKPRNKTAKKYLTWLKEHGYNPYNI